MNNPRENNPRRVHFVVWENAGDSDSAASPAISAFSGSTVLPFNVSDWAEPVLEANVTGSAVLKMSVEGCATLFGALTEVMVRNVDGVVRRQAASYRLWYSSAIPHASLRMTSCSRLSGRSAHSVQIQVWLWLRLWPPPHLRCPICADALQSVLFSF